MRWVCYCTFHCFISSCMLPFITTSVPEQLPLNFVWTVWIKAELVKNHFWMRGVTPLAASHPLITLPRIEEMELVAWGDACIDISAVVSCAKGSPVQKDRLPWWTPKSPMAPTVPWLWPGGYKVRQLKATFTVPKASQEPLCYHTMRAFSWESWCQNNTMRYNAASKTSKKFLQPL